MIFANLITGIMLPGRWKVMVCKITSRSRLNIMSYFYTPRSRSCESQDTVQ